MDINRLKYLAGIITEMPVMRIYTDIANDIKEVLANLRSRLSKENDPNIQADIKSAIKQYSQILNFIEDKNQRTAANLFADLPPEYKTLAPNSVKEFLTQK